MSETETRMRELGINLPDAAVPVGNYVASLQTGNLVFVSGQLPFAADGKIAHTGIVGIDLTVEQGQQAAGLCMVNILAQVKAAIGNLDRITQCVKLTGFVSAQPGFAEHPKVINGASDLIVSILGERGKHTRAAVGVSSLPLNAAVEIEAVFEIA
jgi:enamine deaminase RidA (YjgF/YER057c/UK114 family)